MSGQSQVCVICGILISETVGRRMKQTNFLTDDLSRSYQGQGQTHIMCSMPISETAVTVHDALPIMGLLHLIP